MAVAPGRLKHHHDAEAEGAGREGDRLTPLSLLRLALARVLWALAYHHERPRNLLLATPLRSLSVIHSSNLPTFTRSAFVNFSSDARDGTFVCPSICAT